MTFLTFILAVFISTLVSIPSICASTIRQRQLTQPASKCCFSLHAIGGASSIVLETAAGENRIGGNFTRGSYCVSSTTPSGVLHDASGKLCVIDAATKQFQCLDSNITSSEKFSISDESILQHNGSSSFSVVQAADADPGYSWNIYALPGGINAGPRGLLGFDIKILAGGFDCAAEGRPSPSVISATHTRRNLQSSIARTSASNLTIAPLPSTQTSQEHLQTSSAMTTSTTMAIDNSASISSTRSINIATFTPTSTSSASSPSNCPSNINGGQYLVPRLIVPVSPSSPDTAFGTVSSPVITPNNASIFNFNIPSDPPYTGTCALQFLFPYVNHAVVPYTFTGIEAEVLEEGGLNFTRLTGPITSSTTYNNAPAVAESYGTAQIIPGQNYTIATFPCSGSKKMTIEISSVNYVGLQYLQDSHSVAIGLYVVPCA